MRRLSRLLIGFALAAWLPKAAPAQSEPPTPPVSGTRVAAEIGTSALALPLGFVAGGLLTRSVARRAGASDDGASRAAMVGAWTGAALAAALPPRLIGSSGPATGSYPAAVAGAVAGGVGSYLLIRLNEHLEGDSDSPCRLRCLASTAAVLLLPSVGATIGFNLTRRAEH